VHDFRRTTRGAEGEVLLFHEPHVPPAEGGVPRDATPGDPSTDDEQIKAALAELREGAVASGQVELSWGGGILSRLLTGPREKPVDVVGREAGDPCLAQPGRLMWLVDRPGHDIDTLVARPLYQRGVIQYDFMI